MPWHYTEPELWILRKSEFSIKVADAVRVEQFIVIAITYPSEDVN